MLSGWVGTIAALVGIIVFLGTVVTYLRGSRDRGTITTLEKSNAALTERVAVLEDSERRLKAEALAASKLHAAEIAALNLRLTTLENDNADLRAQRPSAEAIEAVYTLLQVIRSELSAHDAATRELVKGNKSDGSKRDGG